MRHYHRNIVFAGPSRIGLADFEGAYRLLLELIQRLEALGISDPEVPQARQLRAMAETYYTGIRPAIELYSSDPDAFTQASDVGLVRLAGLEQAAQIIDRLGEQHAAESLSSVEQATTTATFVLLAVLGGLGLVGVALAYLVIRMVVEQQAAAEQLTQALRVKTDFIADASHELRTPLTVLRGNAEIALEMDRECVHTEALEEILQESERMAHMVEDLLLLARSDSGSLPLELETVGVAPFLAELAERAEMLARGRGATLQARLAGAGEIKIDPARIEQVVLILVDNAAKYSPDGTQVTLTSAPAAGNLVLEVADQGPGIPEEELPLIFERFYRVDKTRSRMLGGAGLGLSIAKTIVEAHGGRIEARSRPGEGTRMRLYLPLSSPAQASGPALEQLAAGPSR